MPAWMPDPLSRPGKTLAGMRRSAVLLARPAGICTAAGFALAGAFPPLNQGWLAWVAPAPLLATLWFSLPGCGRRRAAAAGICGWCAGLAFFLSNLFWITEVSRIGWIAVCAYLACYPGLWAVVAATVGRPRLEPCTENRPDRPWLRRMFAPSAESLRAALVCASAWTALEWVRGWMFTGFGWNGLGVALHENLVLIQAADVVGVTGLSFFVMLAAATGTVIIARILLEVRHARIRPHADFFAVVTLIMGLFFYGTRRIDQHSSHPSGDGNGRTLHCLVIQPNIAQELKWDHLHAPEILDQFYDATAAGITPDTDLVVWPETAIPYILQADTTEAFLTDVLKLGDFALALGINDVQDDDTFYNALALLKGDFPNLRVYRKTHLVPFGEYIPLRGVFPPFEWIAGDEVTGDFTAGTETVPLPLPGSDPDAPVEVIPLICFEDTIGELARRFLSPNPQLMLTVTNNGWFHQSANSAQHVANARFRCIELRRPMLRSANTGVSCVIEPTGRISSRVHDPVDGSTFIAGALISRISLEPRDAPSFYARHGNLFSKLLAALSAALILGHVIRGRFLPRQ